MARGSHEDHDVVIVSSGAAGGICAYVLATAGVRVLMLQAGRHYDPVTESPMSRTGSSLISVRPVVLLRSAVPILGGPRRTSTRAHSWKTLSRARGLIQSLRSRG